MKNKLEKTLVVGALSFMLLTAMIAVIQPAKAQFVVASWEHPADEYGQGIKLFRFYENSTAAWVQFSEWPYGYWSYNTTSVECPANVGIKIRCGTTLNSTYFGLADETEGFGLFRHNINVSSGGETIFSQQNFTMFNYGHDGAMYSYNYEVVLGFLPVQGTIYTITIIYEIWGMY